MTVNPENVTVLCDRHRLKVAANPEGTSPVVHVAGSQAEACDSARFLVGREDVLPLLKARAEARAAQRKALRELATGIGDGQRGNDGGPR